MAFKYQERSAEATKERAAQSGGLYDSFIDTKFKLFKPKEGFNELRIMPPTWKDAKHYGFDIWLHRDIGPDHSTYACADKMLGKPCACCDARREEETQRGDPDDIDALKPQRVVAMWIIDRNNEGDGPQIWTPSWGMDKDFTMLAIDKRHGSVLRIDHPSEGYDIEFTRTGTQLKTKYEGKAIARKPSYLADDEKTEEKWLQYITDNPLPECVRYFSYEHVEQTYGGKARRKDPDTGEGGSDSRRERVGRRSVREEAEEAEERPASTRRSRAEPEPESEPEERSTRRSARDADTDPPARSRKARPEPESEPEEEEKPAARGRSRLPPADEEEEEEKPKARRSRSEPEDDEPEEKPKARRSRAEPEDEEDEKPARSTRSRREEPPAEKMEPADVEDDEPEEKPAKRSAQEEAVNSARSRLEKLKDEPARERTRTRSRE